MGADGCLERKFRVGIVHPKDRVEGVIRALELISDGLIPQLRSCSSILIKPNFVSCRHPLCATHPGALEGLLEFLGEHYSGKLLLAEGPTDGDLNTALNNYGYWKLIQDHGLDLLDLNQDEHEYIQLYDSQLNLIQLRISSTLLRSQFRISICPPKTHDVCIVTLSLKNMAVGALINGDKSKIHGGYGVINLNIAKLIRATYPQLCIIDGTIGMQGSGPVHGDPIPLGLVGASLDGLSLDKLFCKLMGFEPSQVGYLHLSCLNWGRPSDLSDLELAGETDPEGIRKRFRPHPSYDRQLSWRAELRDLDPAKLIGLKHIT